FAFNYAPKGWDLCDGRLLQIQDNTALFTLLGTVYNGDGKTTFGLPNLLGKEPITLDFGPKYYIAVSGIFPGRP
ncbi:MAG: phage Tail Collar domain protein, partial [Spirosoma sp.]|nr:phage Tail Collar domain protein [Spirosoma sp.]